MSTLLSAVNAKMPKPRSCATSRACVPIDPVEPTEPEPQIVQEPSQKPAQTQEPIIITPRSVRAGNSSGGGKSSYRDVPGYSGGDGTGPLIYNP